MKRRKRNVVEEDRLLNDEIDELQKKKRCLQTDIDSLTASANEYAKKLSRHTRCHGLPSLTASEGLRRRSSLI